MTPKELEHGAVDILFEEGQLICSLFRAQARRPYILELAGTPKAGKTTTLGVVKDFFKDAGFRVSLMRERAGDCPIAMKGHFFFNAWTSATMLSQVLAELDSDCDVLILDRGFFDALVWLELQCRRGQVTSEEREVFERFMLLPRWRTLTDLTVLLFADPKVAMSRENLARLRPREGSIMNESALAAFNEVLRSVAQKRSKDFKVLEVDSTNTSGALATARDLLSKVLPLMRSWVDPEISALRRAVVAAEFGDRLTLDAVESGGFLDRMVPQIIREKRSLLERDDGAVQLVGAVAFRHKGRYVMIERSQNDPKTKRFGARTLWHRCHLQAPSGRSITDAAVSQLTARVREDLHLSALGELQFGGVLWSSEEDERNHLGLAFVVDIDDPETAHSLAMKEFRRGKRAPSLQTDFKTLEELKTMDELETWSKYAARDNLLQDPSCAVPTLPTS